MTRTVFTSFKAIATGLGGALLAAAMALPSVGMAHSSEVSDDFKNRLFAIENTGVFDQVAFLADGVAEISGPYARFTGHWRVFEDELCVSFPILEGGALVCSPYTHSLGAIVLEDKEVRLTKVARVLRP